MTSDRRHAGLLTTIMTLGVLTPGVARAQVSLGLATGELRPAGQPSVGMLTLTPTARGDVGSLRITSSGQLGLGSSGSTRSAFDALVSTRTSAPLGLAPIVLLRGQDDPLLSDTRNRRIDGAVGVRIGTPRLGASATVGRAQSVHGTTNRSVQTSSAAVHVARGGFQLRVGYNGNAFDAASAMPTGQSGFALTRTRLSDITSDGSWKFRRMEVGGFIGRRVGGAPEHGASWGGGFASLMLNDRVSLVARQESAPADPTRHLAAQRSTMLGFRIRPSLSRARFDDGSDAGQFRREFVLSRVEGASHLLRVYQPDARTVELAGSFTEWEPVAMRRTGGGWWEMQTPLMPGLYTFNVRTDGGRWIVPPGLQTSADEFNGTVGVLVIP